MGAVGEAGRRSTLLTSELFKDGNLRDPYHFPLKVCVFLSSLEEDVKLLSDVSVYNFIHHL